MNEKGFNSRETAASLYGELREALRLADRLTIKQKVDRLTVSYRTAYRLLNSVFMRCIDLKTGFAGIRFGGAFAKTDYLLKVNHATADMQRSIHDARVRLRKLAKQTDGELEAWFAHDLKAICQLVSLVWDVSVPADLEAKFPQSTPPPHTKRTTEKGVLLAESLRIIVNRWDDCYIYADADSAGLDKVKVFYGGKSDMAAYKDQDWGYIGKLLTVGCQLNIVRPREVEGILYPELIIWEPDYLVDISAIAACFESYGASPLNHLLNKIKPAPQSAAILLGNLASQLLDETLHQYPQDCPYRESAQRFFRDHALSLLTTDIGNDFHAQAQNQKEIIRETIGRKLPEILGKEGMRFDSSEIIVEPSFFSEMLGLQGRMDFLELHQRVLIEQKSGKGGYPPIDALTPVCQEKHYVQLLLYMLLIRYNFHTNYEQNHHALHAFLLYSKYPNGLLSLGFAPELVFAAIKMRNEIAACEYGYTQHGPDILLTLTADQLNTKGGGRLWEIYQKPQIERLLRPIGEASELERAYYMRFFAFLETEHLLAKVGNHTKENSGFADKWHSSLEDKIQAGNIYCDLQLLSPAEDETGTVERVVLVFREPDNRDISNFRTGDIVVLYPYHAGEEPDVRQTMVFRATIEHITSDQITLNLRAAQTDVRVFRHQGECRWAVEHDFFESSYAALYRGLHAFLSAPKERRDLLLLQRAPQTDKRLQLIGDYGSFNDLALKAKQAQDLFLIIGPPGTGKTSFGLLNTLQEELLSSEDAILLLAYTNRAVDEICGKLVENSIDFIRIGGRFSCEEAYRQYLLAVQAEQCTQVNQLKTLIRQTRVFVGTTTAFNSHVNIFQMKAFSLAIIDEASQILEPHLMGLLSATTADGSSAIRKMILIGDHKQLPAVVGQREEESKTDSPLLHAIHLTDCRLSLFERLLRQYRDNPDVVYMLTRQGRMHRDIALFPNRTFYQDKLKEVPCPHQHTPLPARGNGKNGIENLLQTRRVAFIAIQPPEHCLSDKVNSNEARAIAATAVAIYRLHHDCFSPLQTVGIIVPYRNQIAEIRKHIEAYGIPALREMTIDTVERYQGSQRDCIIYGFTIQKYYQLAFLSDNVFKEDNDTIDRKLNVAMTRAREHLIMFGNPDLLTKNAIFNKLLRFVREEHSYFDISLDDFVKGQFTTYY